MRTTHLRRAAWPAIAGVTSLLLAGCADIGDEQSGSTSGGAVSGFPAELVDAASERASGIVDGERIGGTVTLIGTWGGAERDRFLATLEPFEEATGISVEFTGTEDYESLIQSGIDSGNPIDIAASANLGLIEHYAETGDLVDLNDLIGAENLADNYSDTFLESTTVDGSNYGIWSMVDNYMLWYNPETYEGPRGADVTWDEISSWAEDSAAAGTTPWCMGLSAGANTGWPASYFVLNLLLKQAGPDFTSALGAGEASWDSPEVRAAFDAFSDVVAGPETVNGGPDGAISTDPGAAGAGMYTDPPQCELMHWGTFTSSIVLGNDPSLEPGTDLDFLPMPAITPEYADAQGYGGTIFSAFSDRPEVAALMTYLGSAEHADLIAATGNWTAANVGVDPASYPNELLADIATEILGADTLVPFPTAVTAPAVRSAIYTTTAEFVRDPSSLDANLRELDALAAGG
ncbi:ABC transporter substrate-binding protein [Streptomyces millisiae]|uniref:ABC transporter substrate-binding protein n=1 Tax=Streptomyces millisiae TaxID=3075542 RepID=A0ABU2LZF1_9ACTN|nr:extracellular solute-binding protein [Streptomyces sp. DSM 44918]MDT0322949.1 hypothetical protein [Streptomyces sp. DSM 44918]